MAKNRVTYSVGNAEKTYLVMFPKNKLVGEFLELVREKQKSTDLCAVYLDGALLDNSDLFDDWFRADAVFRVTNSPTEVPEAIAPVVPAAVSPSAAPPPPDPSVPPRVGTGGRPPDGPAPPPVQPVAVPPAIDASRFAYRIYTTANPKSLLEGDLLQLEHNLTANDVRDRVLTLVRGFPGNRLPPDVEVLLYLPGGLPFLGLTLRDYYTACGGGVKTHRIYAVLTRPLRGAGREVIREVCDLSYANAKLYLSPLYDSKETGLADIACLLGYCQHNGPKTEKLLLALAKVTRFAPLITNLYRFLEGEEVTGLNLVAITGALHTLFTSLLPSLVLPDNVFTWGLKLVSFISLVSPVQYLKLLASNWSDATRQEDALEWYCKQAGQQQHYVLWLEDIEPGGESFVGGNMEAPGRDVLESIFDSVPTFKPLSPKTTHYLLAAAIMKGPTGTNYLFLGESPTQRNFIRYLDPVRGRGNPTEGNCDELARAVHDEEIDPLLSQIEGDRRDQAIEICFDASTSMACKLDGYRTRGQDAISRCAIAKNFLRAFADRTFAYRLISAYGLFSFASVVREECPLTYTMDRFEDAMARVTPKGSTDLYTAIGKAAKELIDYFKPDEHGRKKAPARRRILVISDGEDSEWKKNPAARTDPVVLTQLLIDNEIVVDAVLVSTVDENEPLWAICTLTGGLAFRPADEAEGIQLFEQEAFLNLTIRANVAPFERPVTQAVFDAKIKEFNRATSYATRAVNQAVREANQTFPLGTLLYGIRWGAKTEPPPPEGGLVNEDDVGQRRHARILRELKYMKNHMPDDSVDYQAWVNYQSIGKLRVFFRGPPGCPYAGKWWSLYITFPTQYPSSPPVFRFVNVPYHPNISAEGRLLFSELDRNYIPEKRIWDLIVATRNLIGAPETVDPLNKPIGQEFVSRRAEYDRKARMAADSEGAATPDWQYTTGQKHGDEDHPPVAGELDDALSSQLSMTRTKPVPIIINPADDHDIYD